MTGAQAQSRSTSSIEEGKSGKTSLGTDLSFERPKLVGQVCLLQVERRGGVGGMRKTMAQAWKHHVQRSWSDRSQWKRLKEFHLGEQNIKVRGKRDRGERLFCNAGLWQYTIFEGEGHMYKGPTDKDNGTGEDWRWKMGVGRVGRIMEGNGDNCNWTTINNLKNKSNIQLF